MRCVCLRNLLRLTEGWSTCLMLPRYPTRHTPTLTSTGFTTLSWWFTCRHSPNTAAFPAGPHRFITGPHRDRQTTTSATSQLRRNTTTHCPSRAKIAALSANQRASRQPACPFQPITERRGGRAVLAAARAGGLRRHVLALRRGKAGLLRNGVPRARLVTDFENGFSFSRSFGVTLFQISV